jgi:hypothetical protein
MCVSLAEQDDLLWTDDLEDNYPEKGNPYTAFLRRVHGRQPYIDLYMYVLTPKELKQGPDTAEKNCRLIMKCVQISLRPEGQHLGHDVS